MYCTKTKYKLGLWTACNPILFQETVDMKLPKDCLGTLEFVEITVPEMADSYKGTRTIIWTKIYGPLVM